MVIKMTEVEFYKLKAELKNERAQFALAECFENGKGTEKNIKEALWGIKNQLKMYLHLHNADCLIGIMMLEI